MIEPTYQQNPISDELCYQIHLIEQPEEILFHLFKQFKERVAIVTSGQLSGMVLIHMAHENRLPFRVCTIDTLRLFPQTYDFFERVQARYNIHIERIQPDKEEVERMVTRHGEYLFFDSKEKQEHCCQIRKIRPMKSLLNTLDIWFAGLRKDQSEHRQHVPKAEIIDHDGRPVLKVNPLADWTTDRVWKFIREYDIPVNPLLKSDKNGHYYESLGCRICTTPIRPGEESRAGRWRWQNADSSENKKECGLHFAI